MHRTIRVPHALIGGLLVLGLLSGSGGAANAQKAGEVAPPPRVDQPAKEGKRTLTVTVNTTIRLQMKGKQPIETVINERENIARITPVDQEPTMIQITGLQPGTTQLTLTSRADPPREKAVTEYIEVIVEIDTGLLRNLLQRAVPTAVVSPIPAGATIILTGTVEKAEDIETILGIARNTLGPGAQAPINAMRVGGVQMVQLDVVVARVARSELRRFALGDFGDAGITHYLSAGSAGQFGVPTATQTAGFPANTNTLLVNGQPGNPSGAPSNFILGLFNGKQQLFLFLQALRDNNLAKLLAEPHLATLSGRAAHFNSGGQQAVPTVSGFGGTAGVQFYEFGTNLDFLPIVLGNGRIYLDVTPTITALDPAAGVVIPGGGLVPGRLQQTVHTSIILEDGQTLCLAGLIENNVTASTTKVPILGDLPFVGAFFSRKQYNELEEELVVMVTPHLVDGMACNEVVKLLPGQETRTPDDFELFLEGILEAPRGRRDVNHGRKYVPAWQNHPSALCYPCGAGGPPKGQPCATVPTPVGCGIAPAPIGPAGGPGGCGAGGCGAGGCGAGGCGAGGCVNPGAVYQGPAAPAGAGGEVGLIQPTGGAPSEVGSPGVDQPQGQLPPATPEVLR
jgi:pilus assembly protein CpaC